MICTATSVGVIVGGTAAVGLTIYYGPTVYEYTKKGCIYTYNSAYNYFYPPSETPLVETVKVMPVETPASKFAGVSPNFDPLEQFDVQPVADTGFLGYFTNLALFLVAGLLLWSLLIALFFLTVKTRYDLVLLVLFRLVCSVAKENISIKRQQYTVTIFYLFLTIFAANLIGLVPYTFTPTSSFVVTFFLALSHFNGVNLIGVLEHIWRIFNLFLPSGVPVPGAPFLTLIEIISYLARVFSLSIRLFANMMSGHALLKILSGFS
jgi:ATP synthase subunit 6